MWNDCCPELQQELYFIEVDSWPMLASTGHSRSCQAKDWIGLYYQDSARRIFINCKPGVVTVQNHAARWWSLPSPSWTRSTSRAQEGLFKQRVVLRRTLIVLPDTEASYPLCIVKVESLSCSTSVGGKQPALDHRRSDQCVHIIVHCTSIWRDTWLLQRRHGGEDRHFAEPKEIAGDWKYVTWWWQGPTS